MPLTDAITAWVTGYVSSGRLPGAVVLVQQGRQPPLLLAVGQADLEAGRPCTPETVFRIYSMTKPVTAAAAMTLVDEGLLDVDDPVSRFVPSFAAPTVSRGAELDRVPATRSMTVRHLLTHTSGLTYGDPDGGPVERRYLDLATDFGPQDGPLAEVVDRLAGIPLVAEPGTRWTYGVSLDVLGRVLEVAAGQSLDQLFRSRLLDPLGMTDTGFAPEPVARQRLAALYEVDGDGLRLLEAPADTPVAEQVTTLSGGAGLLSTASDYGRFARMLLDGGRAQDGCQVLSAAAVRQLMSNQLPGDLGAAGQGRFNETPTAGVGFGYGGSVVIDPSVTAWTTSPGEYAWGGYASTAFWVDRTRDLLVVLMTQVIPSDHHPLRAELRRLVAQQL